MPESSVEMFCDYLAFSDFVCVWYAESKVYKGVVVAPHVPRTDGGLYWGYSVRLASCLSE